MHTYIINLTIFNRLQFIFPSTFTPQKPNINRMETRSKTRSIVERIGFYLTDKFGLEFQNTAQNGDSKEDDFR